MAKQYKKKKKKRERWDKRTEQKSNISKNVRETTWFLDHIQFRKGEEKIMKKEGYRKNRWQTPGRSMLELFYPGFPTLLTFPYRGWRAQATRRTSIQVYYEFVVKQQDSFHKHPTKGLSFIKTGTTLPQWPGLHYQFLTKEILLTIIFPCLFFVIFFYLTGGKAMKVCLAFILETTCMRKVYTYL